jgi:hypothetical protein
LQDVLTDMPGTKVPRIWAEKFVPFTAFLKADPISGIHRFESIRDLQRKAALIEEQLETVCGSESVTFDFSRPIAYTPQFGKQTARFTVNGNACSRVSFTAEPINPLTVDADNKGLTGPGTANGRAIPSTDLNNIATELRTQLEAATGLKVIRLKVAGYIYGFKGVHFPG